MIRKKGEKNNHPNALIHTNKNKINTFYKIMLETKKSCKGTLNKVSDDKKRYNL